MNRKFFLIIAGTCCFALFMLHIYIAIKGGDLYRYFGAGDHFAQLSESGSLYPEIITMIISLVFLTMSLYAFSGARLIRQLPFLRLMLLITACIFTLRGLMVVPQMIYLFKEELALLDRPAIFSLISLLIGVCYLTGTILNWNNLKRNIL